MPDYLGKRPSEFLTLAQRRVQSTCGEKRGRMRAHDFVWAKSEMQGFRDEMEGKFRAHIYRYFSQYDMSLILSVQELYFC